MQPSPTEAASYVGVEFDVANAAGAGRRESACCTSCYHLGRLDDFATTDQVGLDGAESAMAMRGVTRL